MNGFFGALIATAAVAVFAAPAMAQECKASGHAKAVSGYVMQDLGPEEHGSVATDKPVSQGGATLTCGKWSFDGWYSVELSEEGEIGDRGYGDEIDLSVIFNDTVATPFGDVTFEASASYYLLASFDNFDDDIWQFYADVGYPIQVGPATVTPFFRTIQWVGTGTIPDETLLRTGARFTVPVDASTWWFSSIDGDVSGNVLLTSERSHLRGQVNLTKDLGDGLAFRVETKITERAPTTFGIGLAKSF